MLSNYITTSNVYSVIMWLSHDRCVVSCDCHMTGMLDHVTVTWLACWIMLERIITPKNEDTQNGPLHMSTVDNRISGHRSFPLLTCKIPCTYFITCGQAWVTFHYQNTTRRRFRGTPNIFLQYQIAAHNRCHAVFAQVLSCMRKVLAVNHGLYNIQHKMQCVEDIH